MPTGQALALLSAAMFAWSGCTATSPSPSSDSGQDSVASIVGNDGASGDSVAFTTLLESNTSGFTEPAELVIRDAAAFSSASNIVQQGMLRESPDQATVRQPDFATATVILVAIGQTNTGGYSVAVDRILRTTTGATVHYTVTSPGPNCMTTQMLSAPVQMVSVPRLPSAVRFVARRVVADC